MGINDATHGTATAIALWPATATNNDRVTAWRFSFPELPRDDWRWWSKKRRLAEIKRRRCEAALAASCREMALSRPVAKVRTQRDARRPRPPKPAPWFRSRACAPSGRYRVMVTS